MTVNRFASFLRLCMIIVLLAGTFLQVQTVYAASLPAEINKQFTPLQIDAGGVSVMRVTIFNPNNFQLTNASWVDNLVGVQPGLYIANPAGVVNTCGGTVTATPNTSTLSLSGGTVPAQLGPTPGQCFVEVNVSSVTPGNLINTIPANNLVSQGDDGGTIVNITNTTPASATITVIAVPPPSLSKGFAPNTIFVGQTSQLTITINNNDSDTTLTGASYTDTLPAGLIVATPNGLTVTNCGASAAVSALAAGNTISLSNGTVSPALNCVVQVNVTGVSGQFTNIIPAGPGGPGSLQTNQGVTNLTPASANLNVQPVAIAKNFAPGTVDAGDISNLTITLQNPTSSAYTGVSITDNLTTMGTGYTVAGAPTVNTCGGTITAPIGGTSIVLTSGTIPASATPPIPLGTCSITIPVQTPLTSTGGTVTNTIPANTLTADQPVTNFLQATANLTVNRALVGTKAYSPINIVVGGTSTVTITLTNRSSTPLTGVTFTDTLPANVTVAAAPATPQCGGTVTSTANSVTLTGGTIPANGNCTIIFTVTSNTAGVYDNLVAANSITNDQGVGHALFRTNPDLNVINSTTLPVGLTKAFQTNPIQPGQVSRLRITITAPSDTSISGISITDTLPAGLVIAASPPAPVPTDNCPGGTLTAVAGTNVITFSNTAANVLAAGASCNIDVRVTSSLPATYTNTIPASTITTVEGRTNLNPATATIRVTSLTASKAFFATIVQANGHSRMTITLQNSVTSPLINVTVTDNLPGTATNGIRVAAVPNASTTCGGTLTATPGSATVTLTGGTIPAQVGGVPGLCTITVDVQGRDSTPATPTSYTNLIPTANVSGTVQSTGTVINPTANASAVLSVEPLSIGVVKGFDPVLVYGGAYSTMSVQLINPNINAVLNGIAFTDDMTLLGSGMQLANPVTFNVGTCGGTLTGNPGDTSFTFSGGTLTANSSCTLTLRVVMIVNGNRTNLIPAGAVTTFNGVSNPDPTEASLTNLPGVSVIKSFNPAQVLTNQPSTLTITIRNTSNVQVINMGLADNLPGTLPDGLEVANPANETNSCGGTLTAVPGSQSIQLAGGGLAALGSPGDSCVISVQVLSTRPGVYLNTIPSGAITANGGVTNNDPTEDTLTVTSGTFSLGNRVWFDTDNSATINVAEVGVDGVTVDLYAADGSGNPTGPSLGTTTTTGGGYYRFDNLSSGVYVVVIPSTQFAAGGVLEGYWSSGTTIDGAGTISESAAPDPDNDADSDDNGTYQNSGTFSGAVLSSAVTLGPSANEPTNDNDPTTNPEAGEAPNAQSNRTVDFGFYREELGDLIFVDENTNGTYDSGTDNPLQSATVQLYASNGTTEITVGPDGILGTSDDASGGVTTGASGTYLFSGLPAGDYIVLVTPPAGYVSTVDTAVPADSTNPDTNADDNDNGVGTAIGAVSSNAVTLTPGSAGALSNNTVTNSTGTTYNPTLDFGFVGLVAIGNRVWFDTGSGVGGVANDGIQNGAEAGVAGVRIELYTSGGTFVAFEVTDANGDYYFDLLNQGDYYVFIPGNQFDDATDALFGYISSTGNGTDEITDHDADENGIDEPDLPTNGIRTPVYTLEVGGEPVDDDDTGYPGVLDDDNVNLTADFGFVDMTFSLGNRVWFDTDNSSTINGTEVGVNGVRVELYRDDGTTAGVYDAGDTFIGFDTTGAGGYYRFDNLSSDDYVVVIPSNQFATGGVLEGYWSSGTTISGAGVINETSAADPDDDTDSDDNGVTTFGSGVVDIVSSAAVTLGPSANEPTNDNDPTTNPEASEAPNAQSNRTVDFGFYREELGNLVYLDVNANGTYDSGTDTPLQSATVQLYASNGTTEITVGPDGILGTSDDASGGVTTGASGTYLFSGLPAGDYIVRVTPPAGYVSTVDTAVPADTTDPDTNADNNDNGMGTAVGVVSSNAVMLTPGSAGALSNNTVTNSTGTTYNPTLDFGFTVVYSLGNRVWLDDGSGVGGVLNDGIRNGSEPGINNITVNLYLDSNDDGTPDGGIIATTTTDSNGFYRFDNLPADTYIVDVVTPAGYTSSPDGGDPDNDIDDDDNGVVILGSTVRSNPVTLGPGNEPTGENNPSTNPEAGEAPDDRSNRTVDFGFVTTASLVSLGSTVFNDVNGNGNQDLGETGISGVNLELYLSTQTPGVDTPIATNVTDANGDYFFENLVAGSYIVYIPIPPASAPLSSSPGVTDTNDNSEDGDDNGTQTASGQPVISPVIVLSVDDETTIEPFQGGTQDDSDDDNGDMTVDFGFVPSISLVADPAITKAGDPSLASIGDTVTFTLTVTNIGNAPADDVVINDPLPAIFDIVSVTSVYQAGGIAGTISITPAPAPFNVTVNLGTLDVNDVVIITIETVVTSSGNPPINNIATLTTTSQTDVTSNNVDGFAIQIRTPRTVLPATGFAPNIKTQLPLQPGESPYAATDVILEIPSLGVKLPIVGVPKKNGGWDVTWLGKQAGWLEGTAFPTWKGNSVLTSHVYLANGLPGPFVGVGKLKYGDKVIVHAFGEKYIFEVRSSTTVNPDDISILKHEERSWMTLITCKEYDETTKTYKKRIVVRAVLIKIKAGN